MMSDALPRSTQVVVVGGGPAGAATAWHCAQLGLDVTLVDRAAFPRSKPCAEYVSPEGARILSAMGALETLETQAAPLTGMIVNAPSGKQIRGEFIARHGFRGFRDRGLGITRMVLDATLLESARAAGVRVIERAKVTDVARDGRGTVTGVRLTRENTSADIASPMVIGADGLRSVIARRVGLTHQARWPKRIALVAHFRDVAGMTSLGEMHVTANGYVGLADVSDGVTNVALVVSAHRAKLMHGDAATFLDAWIVKHPALATRFTSARRVSNVQVTGPFASHARRAWRPGVALVGDAADFFDPFTGEGIYAALLGGELVAPFVSEAVRANSPAQSSRALHAYEHARVSALQGKWRVERIIGMAVSSPLLMNTAARILSRDRDLADLLVGVTGDFVPASAMLAPRTLWHAARALVSPSFSHPRADHVYRR